MPNEPRTVLLHSSACAETDDLGTSPTPFRRSFIRGSEDNVFQEHIMTSGEMHRNLKPHGSESRSNIEIASQYQKEFFSGTVSMMAPKIEGQGDSEYIGGEERKES